MLYAAIPKSLYKAKKNKIISLQAFNFYVKLCQYADSKTRECYPSLRLNFKMGGSRIKKLRNELISKGFLQVVGKFKRANVYKLLDNVEYLRSRDSLSRDSLSLKTNTTETNSIKELYKNHTINIDCSNEQYDTGMEEKLFSLDEKETEEKVSTIISETSSPMVTDNQERSEERNLPPVDTLSHYSQETIRKIEEAFKRKQKLEMVQ